MSNPLNPEQDNEQVDDDTTTQESEAIESPFEGEISDGDAIEGNGIVT